MDRFFVLVVFVICFIYIKHVNLHRRETPPAELFFQTKKLSTENSGLSPRVIYFLYKKDVKYYKSLKISK